LVIWQAENVLTVPAGALFRHGDGWAVFRVDADEAHLTRVEPGHRGTRDVEIVSGLDKGQRVILHPSERIESGARVQLRARPGDDS
jgi:HlyD family secretion protein